MALEEAPLDGGLYGRKDATWQSIGDFIDDNVINSSNTFTKPQRTTQTAVEFASTITLDFSKSNDFYVAASAGAFTVANPINAAVGQSGYVLIDLFDSAPSWSTFWNFGSYGLPSDTSGMIAIHYHVQSLTTGGIICSWAGGF